MKVRESNLVNIVSEVYGLSYIKNNLSLTYLKKHQKDELYRIYNLLGGCIEEPPIKFGSWDIVSNKFIIELDEEQHFNRYRKLTLKSGFYENYKWFDVEKYITYCDLEEKKCLKKAKHGKYWKNSSTERQFGIATENGDLDGNGSSRWKQRAYYDFCRDIYGQVFHIPVFRFSIYDEINTVGERTKLGLALEQNKINAILFFLKTKIIY